MFSVPYLAVSSELSADPHQRTRVMMYRLNFMTLGVVVGVGAAQPLMAAFGGGAAGWRAMGLVDGADQDFYRRDWPQRPWCQGSR